MEPKGRKPTLIALAEQHLEFAREEAHAGYTKADETLIRDSAEKTWLAVNEAVDHHMRAHGQGPPVGETAHVVRRRFLEQVDRDAAKQLAYFAQSLHGDCFYQGSCPTEAGMKVSQDEAAQFIKRLKEK